MGFVMTLLLTFAVILVALWVFIRLGPPVYRLERRNLIALLELVIAGRASEADWDVFTGFPIHHDPALAEVQRRCIAIAEREYRGGAALFTREGLRELAEILAELKALEEGGED
ncbi:MAG: hypothetical protein U9R22_09875 [Pseudomonadota bacterium]|jgi:hypothetical protein|nr:hypothetical protein [Pseudomonadota bacterium]